MAEKGMTKTRPLPVDPTERFVALLARRGLHLELDDKGVVWLTGDMAQATDEDRSKIAAYKPVLRLLLRNGDKMMRLDPRTDSRPGARKPKGRDCPQDRRHTYSYAEMLANTCSRCHPEAFRALARTPYAGQELFQPSGFGGLTEEEAKELHHHEAETQRTMSRDDVVAKAWRNG